MNQRRALLSLLLAVLIGVFAWQAVGRPPTSGAGEIWSRDGNDSLPAVNSYGSFVSMMKRLQKEMASRNYNTKSAEETATAAEASMVPDFSATNVQVQGVDEADQVKTDGIYIYQLKQSKLAVTKVNPPGSMSVMLTEDMGAKGISPNEMFVDEHRLTVIGSFSEPKTSQLMTKVLVYNLNNRKDMTLAREVELKGRYLSSRKVGDSLYVVANQYINGIENISRWTGREEAYAPAYLDSASRSGERQTIPWEDIRYIPGFQEPNYLIVAGLELSDDTKPLSVSAYLGAGSTIYASSEHLYVGKANYGGEGGIFSNKRSVKTTSLYKFKLNGGTTEYMGHGEVEGLLLNQFSMDEYKGYFRIATTTGEVWGKEAEQSKNHLFILDENLKPAGEIRDIAPGERIYSMRFMGERGYMVTFKKVDPLFVFDLADPMNPEILGKLKIPGYSDYLHPYDENHMIGFGKETVEAKQGDFAYYQGLKMALFDITDVNHPKEKFVEIIGDRGTDSELLHNHKALLFSKERDLIAFPVSLAELPEGVENEAGDSYGQFVFQGAFVYSLDLAGGFELRGRITHLSEEDMEKSGDGFDYAREVRRILYIGDTLYTVSDSKIEAHGMSSLAKLGEVDLP